jgi:hypothetical protein
VDSCGVGVGLEVGEYDECMIVVRGTEGVCKRQGMQDSHRQARALSRVPGRWCLPCRTGGVRRRRR